MINKILLLLFLTMTSSLMADRSVSAWASVNRENHANKSMESLRITLIERAKLDAASKLFGDFIKSQTIIKNGSLIKDLILAKRGGIVHIKGNPIFSNGENLGELQVKINAYATDKDIRDMMVQRITLETQYSNEKMNAKELKRAAKDAFVIEAISQKKPSIKNASNAADRARKMALSVNIEKMEFDSKWMAYKMSGYVEYVPIFLRSEDTEVVKKPTSGKAYLSVAKRSGGMKKFTLAYDSKGIVFTKQSLQYIKTESKRSQVFMNLTATLVVPKNLKGDSISVKAMGRTAKSWRGSGSYKAYVAERQIEMGDSEVISKNADGNLKLKVTIICFKRNYDKAFPSIVKELRNLRYVVSDSDEEAKFVGLRAK